MTSVQNQVALLAQHWPLAPDRQARVQAVRLIRARRYLRKQNIEAWRVKSAFDYSPAPKILNGGKQC